MTRSLWFRYIIGKPSAFILLCLFIFSRSRYAQDAWVSAHPNMCRCKQGNRLGNNYGQFIWSNCGGIWEAQNVRISAGRVHQISYTSSPAWVHRVQRRTEDNYDIDALWWCWRVEDYQGHWIHPRRTSHWSRYAKKQGESFLPWKLPGQSRLRQCDDRVHIQEHRPRIFTVQLFITDNQGKQNYQI